MKASSTNKSSSSNEQGPKPASQTVSHPISVNIIDKSDILAITDMRDKNTSAGPSTQYIAHAAHRQHHDLLGLILPAPNNHPLDHETNISYTPAQITNDEKIVACPVHGTLSAGFYADDAIRYENAAVYKSASTPLLAPMDRYVAEGLAERYTLVKVGYPGTGREFSRCLCETSALKCFNWDAESSE
jgi:hypothetical protein